MDKTLFKGQFHLKEIEVIIPLPKIIYTLERIKLENMKSRYIVLLGVLSGMVSFFLFMSLDFYFFLEGPARLWFTPINMFILPVIVALLVTNIVTHKLSFTEKIYSNVISGLTAYIGSMIILSIIESIALSLRP